MKKKQSNTTEKGNAVLPLVNVSIDVPPVRVRYWNYSADEKEDGTVIDVTKTDYVVIPDVDIRPTVRWPKMDCEVLR